jgi:cytochrome c biogenesis protein CcdA
MSSASSELAASTSPTWLRYGKSFVVGSSFAVGWTPCIGPILGAVLTLAASSSTVAQGALLLATWSAGLGLPFLLAGLASATIIGATRKLRPVMPVLEVVGGVLVMLVGILIFLDRFTVFNSYFTGGVGAVTGGEQAIEGFGVAGPFGFLVAFAAGIIAFISPCCLPLVPAYIAHLAGVSSESDDTTVRTGTFRHSLAFVLGFSVVFVILGASLGVAGFLVRDQLPTIQKVAGVLLVVMGLNLTGIIRIPWLYRTYQIDIA